MQTTAPSNHRITSHLSLVLEERNGDWLVVHAHFSVPAASQEKGDTIPA